MPSRQSILVVEDCFEAYQLIQRSLTGVCIITWARTIAEAMAMLVEPVFDAVLLDVTLPDGCGFEACRQLRMRDDLNTMPIIMLTAKDSIEDKIKAFQAGCDMYITKPYDRRELKARVEAMLARVLRLRFNNLLTVADLTIDKHMQKVYTSESIIKLTPTEFKILMLLVSKPGTTFNRDTINEKIWGDNETSVRQVDTQISKLRKKLGNDKIQSIHGIGYRFAA